MNSIEDLAKIISENLDSQHWESKTEEEKQSYTVAANAVLAEVISPFKGRVVQFFEDEEGRKPYELYPLDKQEWEKLWNTLDENDYNPRKSVQRRLRNLRYFVENAITYRKNEEDRSWNRLKRLQDDVLTFLRAIALVAETVGNAHSHAEKNARLRGLISLIETAITKVRGNYDDLLSDRWAANPDLFSSDYPVRKYVEQIHELKQENARLKGESLTSSDDELPM